jgi:hypothetical protein
MTKEEFQDSIFPVLLEKGYKPVTTYNGKPYHAKDTYFCPQAPDEYLLIIHQNATRISKVGKGSFDTRCQTQVKSPSDIEQLHEELNNIILRKDTSGLDISKGCMLSLLLIISLGSLGFLLASLVF